MQTFDLTPLFRTAVGFDRVARMLEASMNADTAANGYPPYNIEKLGEDDYRITMAVAGFTPADIEVVQKEQTLVVSGKQAEKTEGRAFLHRGIASRAFERRFQLADHIRVVEADLANGLLDIVLKRVVPEAARPRVVPIGTKAPAIEGKAEEQKAA